MNRHCRPIRIFALLGVFVLISSMAWAQSGRLHDVAAQARGCGLGSGVINQVLSLVAEDKMTSDQGGRLLTVLLDVCRQKLPVAPFEDKLVEGLSKRVAPERITVALEGKFDQYLFAHDLLLKARKAVAPQGLVIMGEALGRGTSQEDVVAYVKAFGGKADSEFLLGLEMATLLSQADVPFPLVQRILTAGFDAGTISSDWRYLVKVFLVARQRGLADATVAEAAEFVLREGGSMSDLMPRLGFTGRDLKGRSTF